MKHMVIPLLCKNLFESGAHDSNRQRVAGKSSAHAANIAILKVLVCGNGLRNAPRESVGRPGNSTANGLAAYHDVGIEIFCARVASWPGTDGVGFVDDQQSTVPPRRCAQPLVKTRIRKHDADVRQCRLGENAGDIPGLKSDFNGGDIVEFNYLSL